MYKSIVVKFAVKARNAAEAIDCKANELETKGLELVSVAFVSESKAVATFKGDEAAVRAYNDELDAQLREREEQKLRDKEDARDWHKKIKEEAKARKAAAENAAKKEGKKDKKNK